MFLLGSTSWRIRRVEAGIVRVVDAEGAPPTVPFWLGEAPARTAEASAAVSALREALDERLGTGDVAAAPRPGSPPRPASTSGSRRRSPRYLGRRARRARRPADPAPRRLRALLRRGGRHAARRPRPVRRPDQPRPRASRSRKRFCRRFDFELQAAASDDAVVLSLGPGQSFPLDGRAAVPRARERARRCSRRPLLLSPMFHGAVALEPRPRARGAAPARRAADAAADPAHGGRRPRWRRCSRRWRGCQENAGTGPIEIPDHPIVRQTMHDCLHEATDADGLVRLFGALPVGRREPVFRETTEPSPLAHEILNGRPYTFLDDAPLEERRTRAWRSAAGCPRRRAIWRAARPDAIARVREEARPDCRDAGRAPRSPAGAGRPAPRCPPTQPWFQALADVRRAASASRPARGRSGSPPSSARGSRRCFRGARIEPDVTRCRPASPTTADEEEAAASPRSAATSARLGPCTVAGAGRPHRPRRDARSPSRSLASRRTGFVLRGRFDPARAAATEEYCERRLLARIHRYTTDRLRREIEPVTAQDLVRFLLRWQHVAPDTPARGTAGSPDGDRAAPGIRDRRGLLGGRRSCRRASRGYRPRVARRALPRRARSRGRASRIRSAPARRARGNAGAGRGSPSHSRRQLPRAGEPAVAAPRRARRRRADLAGARPDPRRAGVPRASAGALFFHDLVARDRTAPDRGHGGALGPGGPRRRRPRTGSAACARSSARASAGPAVRAARAGRAAPAAADGRRRRGPLGARAGPARRRARSTWRRWLRRSPSSYSPAGASCSGDLIARESARPAVARDPVGVPASRGARHDPRQPLRHGLRRRAVRAARMRSRRSARSRRQERIRRDRPRPRGRPAEPGRHPQRPGRRRYPRSATARDDEPQDGARLSRRVGTPRRAVPVRPAPSRSPLRPDPRLTARVAMFPPVSGDVSPVSGTRSVDTPSRNRAQFSTRFRAGARPTKGLEKRPTR